MGSSKKVTVGYRYYMGLHFGLCHGPVDAVRQISIGDREAWVGNQTASGSLAINAPELFGGDKREGGIVGFLDVAMGDPAQTENGYLASQLGAVIPAFRGIMSAVWRGGQVAANNPYVKPWAFRVKRILKGWSTGAAWYSAKAEIGGVSCASSVVMPELVLDALEADTAGVNGTTYTLSPFDVLTIEYTQGLTYDAFSYFPTDGDPAASGLPWSCQVSVKTDGGTITDFRTTRYATAAAANAAALASGPITLTGHTTYTVFIWDNVAANNRGGLSLKISVAPASVDMNPAHIVYQCLTNSDWGMGYPTSAIDNTSFTAVADELYAEQFGLSFLWNQQETIENFVQIVLDHIGALLYVRPDTSTFALKLIRSDYDRAALPLYGPESLISASDYQRQAWGETINEITVVYTDACSGKESPTTAQDIANIQIQGGVVAQTRHYPGIRRVDLAQRVALRDLQAASTPLARIKLTATRALWQVFPGDVFRLSWPEFDIADVVFRALNVNRGTLQNGEIIIDAVEDVFGLPDNTYLAEQPGEWVDPSGDPVAAPYRKLLESPYWDLARNLSAADMAYVDTLSGYLETLAVRPSNDATNYSIQVDSGAGYQAEGNGDFCPSATVVGALTKTTTAITLANGIDLDLVEPGGYAIIDDEYVLVLAIDAVTGTATISRGLLDTVPAEHSASARIWFADGDLGFSSTEYADGETVDVKLLPATGQGTLDIALAPADSLTFDQRQYRPYAPGKLMVNTAAYPEWIDGLAELALSWAHRDRLAQTAYLVEQSEASIGPEAGVTYDLRIYGESDTLIHTETGLSGTSYTYPAATEGADSCLSGGGDPDWDSVISLLNFPGADGSTTINDEKGRTWTANGNAQIDNSLGYNTLLLDGAGDNVITAHGSDFDWFNNDYTMEAWVNPVDLSTWSYIDGGDVSVMLGWRDVASGESVWDFGPIANGALVFRYYTGASQRIATAGGLISNNTLTHVAMSKNGTTIRLAVAGTIHATGTRAGSSLVTVSRPVVVGQGNNRSLSGRIRAMRLTMGVGKYTANFTPPPAPLPDFAEIGRNFNGRLRFELEAKRGGLVSYQKHNHTVLREGYGFNYGYYYGGQ